MMLIWQVAQRLFGASANTPWIPFWSAIAVGTVIYLMSVGDKNVSMSTREKIIGGFIALVNSLVLFSAALGIAGPIAPGSH